MTTVAILGGAGIQAHGIAQDLLHYTTHHLLLVDANEERLSARRVELDHVERIQTAVADLADVGSVAGLLANCSAVVNSGPPHLCHSGIQAALGARVPYTDLGTFPEELAKQKDLSEDFEHAGLLAVVGVGSAPGITNLMARAAVERLDTVHEIDLIIAMHDSTERRSSLHWPYSIDAILDEYEDEVVAVRAGEPVKLPPRVAATYNFPLPIGETYPLLTNHPEPMMLLESYAHKGCKNVSFRIALPTALHTKVTLLTELGLASKSPVTLPDGSSVRPRDVALAVLANLPRETDAIERQTSATRVIVTGTRDGRGKEVVLDLITGSHLEWNLPAGLLKTAIPSAIVAAMLVDGAIDASGIRFPEDCIDERSFFNALALRGMTVSMVETDLLHDPAVG